MTGIIKKTMPIWMLVFSLACCGNAYAGSTLILGAGLRYAPDYAGSDDYKVSPLPLINYKWTDDDAGQPNSGYAFQWGPMDLSVGFPDGIDVGVARLARPTRNLTLRLGAGYRGGRDEDDNDALDGMGAIDGQGILRVTLADEPANPRGLGTFYGLRFEADATDETNGNTLSFYAGHKLALSEDVTLALSAYADWANENYMQSYFGVSGKQAAHSSHQRFDASSGIAEVGLKARVNWSLTEHWMLIGNAGYSRLTGDAADSPLVDDEGAADQFSVVTGLVYRF